MGPLGDARALTLGPVVTSADGWLRCRCRCACAVAFDREMLARMPRGRSAMHGAARKLRPSHGSMDDGPSPSD